MNGGSRNRDTVTPYPLKSAILISSLRLGFGPGAAAALLVRSEVRVRDPMSGSGVQIILFYETVKLFRVCFQLEVTERSSCCVSVLVPIMMIIMISDRDSECRGEP